MIYLRNRNWIHYGVVTCNLFKGKWTYMCRKREPMLTAIIPVYNGGEKLKKTLENILQMKYHELEIILIDDGSIDNSSRICREYEALDKRFHYIKQENQGIAASRNKGLELAKGEYVCFWDQDDIVIEDGYFELFDKIQNKCAQMGMCSTRRLIQGKVSDYEKVQDHVYFDEGIQRGLLYPLLFRGYKYNFFDTENYIYGSVWKCIFRTDFVRNNQIKFRKFVNFEDDWIFVTRALCCAQNVVTTSRAGYCWRVNDNSESHKGLYIENLQDKFRTFDDYVFYYLGESIKDVVVLNEYQKINLCAHYMELYRNAANVKSSSKRECRKNVKEYLCRTSYKKQLLCRRKLKKSAYRMRVVLSSLQYGGITITFAISRGYDWLESKMERVQWVVDIERKYKLK